MLFKMNKKYDCEEYRYYNQMTIVRLFTLFEKINGKYIIITRPSVIKFQTKYI